MNRIAIFNQKGGVAKTTTALNTNHRVNKNNGTDTVIADNPQTSAVENQNGGQTGTFGVGGHYFQFVGTFTLRYSW